MEVYALFLTNCIAKAEDAQERREMMAVIRQQWQKVSGMIGIAREIA